MHSNASNNQRLRGTCSEPCCYQYVLSAHTADSSLLLCIVLTTEHCVFARTAKCVAIARRLQTRSVHQVLFVRTTTS